MDSVDEQYSYPFNVLKQYFGNALESDQLRRTFISFIFFTFLSQIAASASSHYIPEQYNSFTKKNQGRWNAMITSGIHAIVISILCCSLVIFPDETINEDRVYGKSDRASLVFAIAAGFFAYDTANCLKMEKIDPSFVFHHVACCLCYMFVQFPFLQYYAIRFLLFELSTPFLDARVMLMILGHTDSAILKMVEQCFGYTFLIVRICMGIPLSITAFIECYDLLMNRQVHSYFVFSYFCLANVGLNVLNLYWLSLMVGKKKNKNE